jgi:chaperonin GroEL (HSP60 family)
MPCVFGVALLRAKAAVGKLKDGKPDIQAGINIVFRALGAPVRQIVENAGVEGSVVVGKINENKSETYGFDAQTEQYVQAYQRSAMLERRTPVMQAWASFVAAGAEANVVPLKRA